MNKKQTSNIYLSNNDLVLFFSLLTDEINFIQESLSDPNVSPDEKIFLSSNLNKLLPVQQKLNKYFTTAGIHIKEKDSDTDLLKSYGIDTNL